ncbi:MAG TPA: thiamine-phosphate kinase [Gammaproteobacteria bacterium]|nr:thiamine-phosphate kinase [Gammaproteobacteria bacterium]
MNEFELIRKFFSGKAPSRKDVILGVGDDAAILSVPQGMQLVATVDTLVEGVHFPAGLPAEDIGHRSLAVNLSDIAAMGAEPAWALLALTLPNADEKWLTDFTRGFLALAQGHAVELVGGNIARGPLNVTVTAHGFVPDGMALTRRGAQPGDHIYVSGELGAAAAGLRLIRNRIEPEAGERLRTRFARPEPRIALGLALRGLASACIDISDGFFADLVHVLQSSGVGAEVNVDALPLADEAVELLGRAEARQLAFAGGDDYELCFSLPPSRAAQLKERLSKLDCAATQVGVVTAGKTLQCLQADGSKWVPDADTSGYQHFE